eukprot:1158530-Pelagomonas_calceolata.AAC.3
MTLQSESGRVNQGRLAPLLAWLGHTRVWGQPYAFLGVKYAYIAYIRVSGGSGQNQEGGSRVVGAPGGVLITPLCVPNGHIH